MTSRIWSEEMVRVTTNAMMSAREHQKRVADPNVRLCLEEIIYVVEVLMNQEVRRANDA